MHEATIAASMIEDIRSELERRPGRRLLRLGLRVGELSGVDAGLLKRSLEELIRDTELQAVEIEVEPCPRRHRCNVCGEEFTVLEREWNCPNCGDSRTDRIGGDELELAYLEVEDA